MQLEDKIYHTIQIVEMFYTKTEGKCFISYSGGKDSAVLDDILNVRYKEYGGKLWNNIPCVFCDTGLENIDNKKFIKEKGNVIIIRPEMNFLDTVINFGYPLIRKEVANVIYYSKNKPGGSSDLRLNGLYVNPKTGDKEYDYSKWKPISKLPIIVSDRCCAIIKKKPFKKYTRETGLHPIVGTTADESLLRRQSWYKTGCNTFNNGRIMSRPLSIWCNQDILQYIVKYKVPISNAYGEILCDECNNFYCSEYDRTGCSFCAFGLHQEKGETRYQRLKRLYPNIYDFAINGGEWIERDGKKIWTANKKGLGFGKVFDMVNEIYGQDFYRYK